MRVVVAVPVCNERAHIAACLRSLESQRGVTLGSFGVLLFLNNCRDGTGEIIAETTSALAMPVRVISRDDPNASAGWARCRAMAAAAAWLDEGRSDDAVLMTTDADSRVRSDWIARNLSTLDAGADAVAGRLELDAEDAAALPAAIHVRGALEARYDALLTELTARLDPVPGDPWPRHWCHSGASIAVRLDAYRAVGGMPDVALGEDRAFFDALLAHDRVVRHDPGIVVVTSGRLQGRAVGGVADTIRKRCEEPESFCDDRLERLDRAVIRALLCRRVRRLHAEGRRPAMRRLARVLSVDVAEASRLSGLRDCGAVLAALEAASPRLAPRPLRPAALPRQIRRAERLVAILRMAGLVRSAPRIAATPRPAVIRDRIAAEACD